jgi:hypothetical protein
MGTHGSEGVGVLTELSFPDNGPDALGSPAPTRIAKQAEAAFILEHRVFPAAVPDLSRTH